MAWYSTQQLSLMSKLFEPNIQTISSLLMKSNTFLLFVRKLEFDNYIKIVLCNRRGTVQKLKENKPQRKGKNRGYWHKLGPRHGWRHHLVKALSLRNLREKTLE